MFNIFFVQVRILYLRGLLLATKEEKLEEMITKMFDHKALERVKKIRDFAFVHFYNREDAEVATMCASYWANLGAIPLPSPHSNVRVNWEHKLIIAN